MMGPHPYHPVPRKDAARSIQQFDAIFAEMGFQPPRLRVVLADVHGDFNGISNPGYLTALDRLIKELLGERAETLWLSQLYTQYGMSSKVAVLDQVCGQMPPLSHSTRESLLRGARHRNQTPEQALRYAALRWQENPLLRFLLRDTRVLVVVGDPAIAPLFAPLLQGLLFVRMRAHSGKKYVNRPFWIPK
jgi:hypothetical protein